MSPEVEHMARYGKLAAALLVISLRSAAQQPLAVFGAPAAQPATPVATPAGASGRGGRGNVIAEITGDPRAGLAFFNGAGRCNTCHSVTGDLQGVGSRMNPTVLQGRMVYPRGNGAYPTGGSVVTPQGAKPDRPKNATVTLADGTKYTGDVTAISDFIVTLTDKDGARHTFTRDGDVPKVVVTDPLQAHIDLLPKLTDKTMHDLTAYLVTLK
jgi:cytochrome c oxidase cbb3-type subunit 3